MSSPDAAEPAGKCWNGVGSTGRRLDVGEAGAGGPVEPGDGVLGGCNGRRRGLGRAPLGQPLVAPAVHDAHVAVAEGVPAGDDPPWRLLEEVARVALKTFWVQRRSSASTSSSKPT